MQHLLCDNLWLRLKRMSRSTKRRLAAVAFFSDGALLKFGKGDTLIVDASDARVKAGETSAKTLAVGKNRLVRQAVKGDSMIEIWKPLGNGATEVCRATPILLKQREPTCTRFYVEEPPGRAKTAISLKVFRKLASQAGITQRVGSNSQRLLSEDKARLLALMWNDFVRKRKRRR